MSVRRSGPNGELLDVRIVEQVAGAAGLTDTELRASPVPVSITGGGDASAANQLAEQVLIGAVTEVAPATDTASSGLNGRLQRIAQRITALITALGSPFQAGGSIGNTTFAATQATAASLNMTEASAAAILATLGATTGAAVITDADGTIQRYLRGIVKLAITAGGWLVTATGSVAHDAADSGNPVKIGGKAATALPTAVAAADRTDLLTDVYGRPFVRHGAQGPAGGFSHNTHAPAANTKATITKAAGAAGVRHVCTSITVVLAGGATAPAAIQVSVALIDGASGGGTYLWGPNVIAIPAVAGAVAAFVVGQCWKPGTAATAMTLEFSAAGGANTIESVEFDSTTVAE